MLDCFYTVFHKWGGVIMKYLFIIALVTQSVIIANTQPNQNIDQQTRRLLEDQAFKSADKSAFFFAPSVFLPLVRQRPSSILLSLPLFTAGMVHALKARALFYYAENDKKPPSFLYDSKKQVNN